MQYRIDPKTGNRLSVLGFGCMRLPGKRGAIDQDKSTALIRRAIEDGVNYFDTAYMYAGSEEALGRALQGGLREQIYIADKMPPPLCRRASDFDKLLHKMLGRLGTDYIDYFLIHMLTDVETWKHLCRLGIEEWIQVQKQAGRIRSIGFSYHGGREEFPKLLDAYDWDFCQIQYNYIDENNQAGRSGLQKASEKGLPVMIMEPLLGGRLADSLPPAAEEIFQAANPSITPAEWGLRWIWDQPQATVVLSGMSTQEQLLENTAVAEAALPGSIGEDERRAYGEVAKAFRSAFKIRCTACGYCMPCPYGVDIPSCFAAYNTAASMGKKVGRSQYMNITGAFRPSHHYASLCRECGGCEKRCPQKIQIRAELKKVAGEMEPFWFRPAMAFTRAFSKKGASRRSQ